MNAGDTSAYRKWYEFLRRSERYIDCCDTKGSGPLAKLFADFGDVREEWDHWWPNHRYLFEDAEPNFVVDVIPPGQLSNEEGDRDLLTLLINLYQPHRTIIREVIAVVRHYKKLLLEAENEELEEAGKKQSTGKGAPVRDLSLAHRYGLKYNPRPSDIASLQLTLDVFDVCNAEDAKPRKYRKRRYQIAEELGICHPISLDITGELDRDEINRATALTCRYYRQAKNLIDNVELGIFPDRCVSHEQISSNI